MEPGTQKTELGGRKVELGSQKVEFEGFFCSLPSAFCFIFERSAVSGQRLAFNFYPTPHSRPSAFYLLPTPLQLIAQRNPLLDAQVFGADLWVYV